MEQFRQMLTPFYLHRLCVAPMLQQLHKTHWHLS